jgi:hypothetical protein
MTHAQSQRFSSTGKALEAISGRFSVPIGYESATDDRDDRAVELDLSIGDLGSVFRRLVEQRRGYAWKFEDGFYDVYPKSKNQSLCRVVVPQFRATNVTLAAAVEQMRRLPQVQEWLSRLGTSSSMLIGGSRLGPPPRKSFALVNASVCSILNNVYSAFGVRQWRMWREGGRVMLFAPI